MDETAIRQQTERTLLESVYCDSVFISFLIPNVAEMYTIDKVVTVVLARTRAFVCSRSLGTSCA